MANAFQKDVTREIRNTIGRFCSIFAIVALGVAFYSGLGATGTKMKIIGDEYVREQNLMDIRVVSTYGLNKNDLNAIRQAPGVRQVMPSYSIDALTSNNETTLSLKVHALDIDVDMTPYEMINIPVLSSGRFPQKGNETVVEESLLHRMGIEIGDVIRLDSGKKTDIRSNLKTNTYRIVGTVSSPYYVSLERGTSSIGNGKVDCYMYIPSESFSMDVCTEAFVTVDGVSEMMSFSDAYDDAVELVVNRLEDVGEIRAKERLKEMTQSSFEALNKSEEEALRREAHVMDELEQAEKELTGLNRQLQRACMDISTDRGRIASAQNELDREIAEFQREKDDALKQIADGKLQLKKARGKLYDIDEPEWYVFDRSANVGYAGYGSDTDKIGAIGQVFPLIFFIVAALVSLTTMTRLVEERRTEIGTLKSLGYGNAKIMSKYIIYAAAPTLLGGIIGGYAGMQIFPEIIIRAYGMLYSIPYAPTPLQYNYWAAGLLLAVFSTTAAAFGACRYELMETPANLMRPKSPKIGKRILFEYIPVLWSRLSFSYKVTIRNLFRYKKRFFMTITGISGCSALLITGFGIYDSFSDIIEKQYGKIHTYDMIVVFSDSAKQKDVSNVEQLLRASPAAQSSMAVRQKSMTAENGTGGAEDAYIIVTPDIERLKSFINFRDRVTQEEIWLDNEGIIITEKLARLLGLSRGDEIIIHDGGEKRMHGVVTGISENYLSNYMFIASGYYEDISSDAMEENAIYAILDISAERSVRDALANDILDKKGVGAVNFVESTVESFRDTVKGLNIIVYVLIISAGLLAFVVLLNLTNINISERVRELATIEVLGFYDREVASYVYRENIALTVIGGLIGLAMGVVLHGYIIVTTETGMIMFSREIHHVSFVYAMALTLSFSAGVNVITSGKLRRIDMVEALKSVE